MAGPDRYAIYFVPRSETPLGEAGARWLGYDAASGTPHVPPPLAGISQQRWAELTRAPRRYGFHATLKPPFRLAEGCTETGLAGMAGALAKGLKRVTVPRLIVSTIGDFLALVPDGEVPELAAVAAASVRALDAFRAPPDDADRERYANRTLNADQRALLADWGYPYLLGEFRFHLTLTGPVAPAEREAIAALLRHWFAPALDAPVMVDGLSLVHQPDPAAPFRVQARFALAA